MKNDQKHALEKLGYLTLTDPQKNMDIIVDVLSIAAIKPFVWHEHAHMEDGETTEDGEVQQVEVPDRFHFVSTVLHMTDRVELHVRERPHTVARRMLECMESKKANG